MGNEETHLLPHGGTDSWDHVMSVCYGNHRVVVLTWWDRTYRKIQPGKSHRHPPPLRISGLPDPSGTITPQFLTDVIEEKLQ
jgi:hypothetical protein